MRPFPEQVYAILRFDGFFGAEAKPETAVTVKEIVWTLELAKSETERLNALNGHKNVRYWWRTTRLYADGESAGTHDE